MTVEGFRNHVATRWLSVGHRSVRKTPYATKEFASVPPQADWSTCRKTLNNLLERKHMCVSLAPCASKRPSTHTSQPSRRNTVAQKHSSHTKDVLIRHLLHFSTVACARSPAGRQLQPRHPKRARARFAPTSRC